MIRIIDFHIGRAILQSTFVSLMVLTALSGLIRFVEQLKSIGRGSYELLDAAQFVLYTVPRDIEMFFPMAALLGGLLGLGALATNSELIVMQAAGLSRADIVKSAMKTSTILVVMVLLLGEFVAPKFEAKADEIRNNAIYESQAKTSQEHLWAKDGQHFVHIAKVDDYGVLNHLTIYEFDLKQALTQIISAEKAVFSNKTSQDKGKWVLTNVSMTMFADDHIKTSQESKRTWFSSLSPDKLNIVSVKPESLSLKNLIDYLDYLKSNEQDGSRYQLAFWRKIFQPITVAVMMLMALSFVFGPLRSTSMGARILMGVMIGFGFHITDKIFGPIALVYELPAALGALMPSLIFVLLAINLIRRRS